MVVYDPMIMLGPQRQKYTAYRPLHKWGVNILEVDFTKIVGDDLYMNTDFAQQFFLIITIIP
tara:strand:- start:1316 stop:1501 length:186 start_codon:yes stop_codon:yes gene_type:complete